MNIQTLKVTVKSEGISQTAQQIRTLGTAADATEQKVQKLVQAVNSMAKQFAAGASGTKAMTDALAATQKTTQASDAAMKSLAISVGESAAATKAMAQSVGLLVKELGILNARLQQGSANVNNSTKHIVHHTAAMSDAHAAARGLTGSLGALWLTYGNVAPLAAGAAIGASLKAIVTIGTEVEHTLENIRIKGENSAEAMQDVAKAVQELGTGVYGPQEIAKALETLSLAGLKAKDSVNAIGAAVNLAIVGGTDINKAAEGLVTIGTAVGATSKEYDFLADAIAKTANVSLASVESISEAVKRASVVNKLYGASFEDILTQTAALAQLGIKNTAAGTAITNFYANALGGTEKANKALQELGFSFQDATGKAKPLVAAFTEFKEKLDQFDLKSQQKIITDIFGERALRDVQAQLNLLNTAAESLERNADGALKYKNRLEELQAQIQDAAGTAALQAAQQASTTENLFKSVSNTLKSSFGEAFKAIEPDVQRIARNLREVFASQEFKTALTNIASGFANIAKALSDNIPVITAVVEGLLAYVTITSGGKLFSAMIPYIQGIAVAFGAVTTSVQGATVATGAFGLAIRALPGIGLILGAATAAFALYSIHADKAKESTQKLAEEKAKLADEYNGDFLENLRQEVIRMEQVNTQLEKGVDLREAELKVTKELALEKSKAKNQEAVAAAESAVSEAKKNPQLYSFIGNLKAMQELKAAQEQLNKAKEKALEFDKQAADLADRARNASAFQQSMLRARQNTSDILAEKNAGTKTFGGTEDSAVKKQLSFLEQENLQLTRAKLGYEARTKAVIESYTSGEKAITGAHQATVEANKLEGKYANDRIYREQLAKAAAADAAKLELDRQQIYGEVSQKINDIIKAEEKRQEMAGSGEIFKGLRKELEAAAAYTKVSEEQLEIDRKRAEQAERIRIAADNLKRLEAATGSTRQRAEGIIEEADAMAKYGEKVKLSAIAAAELLIEKLKLNTLADESAKNALLEAAALEQVGRAYNNLQRITANLNDDLEKAQADSLLLFADNEKKKVAIWADGLKKRAKMELDAAEAAADANPFNPEIQARAISAFSSYRQTVEKIDQVSNEKINNANLQDWKKTVDNIVNDSLDGFNTIFDRGTSIWKSLTKSIQNMFKSTVIEFLKKEFAKPLVLNVVANIAGSLGLDGIAKAATAMGGGNKDGSPLSVVSAASNIYKAITGGFDKIATGIQQGASWLGNATGSQAITNSGQFLGAVGSNVAGIGAGIGLGRSISNGYSAFGGSGNSAVNVSTIIGNIVGGPIGAAIGGAIGGVINRAFGRKPKEIESQGIRGTVGEMGATGESFQNWIRKGGWFRSDKRGTDTQALGSDITNTLSSGFTELKVLSESFAKTLGVSSDSLNGFTKSFDIAFGNDVQKNQEAVAKFFIDLGDEFASKLIPNIADFAKQGETASQTLERLAGVFEATNAVAAILGKTVEEAFGAVGIASASVRNRLVELAGGADKLASKTAEYASSFLTDAEKLAPVQKAVENALKSFGLAGVTTKEQFKQIVNSLDLTTEAGAKLFNDLLDLAPAFAQVAEASEALLEQQKEAIAKAKEAALEAAMDNVDRAFGALKDAIGRQRDVLKSDYDAQVARIKKLAEIRKAAVQKELDLAKENLSNISKVFDALSNAIKSTKIESDELTKSRRNSAMQYLQSIRGTDLTKATGLNSALEDLGAPSEQFFSTFEDYARDQAKAAELIGNLQNQASVQKSFAELTIERLDATIKAIEDQTEAQLSAAEARYQEEMAKLDKQLELAQAQIDALNGIHSAVLTIPQAIQGLKEAIALAQATKISISPSFMPGVNMGDSSIRGGIESLYNNLLGRKSDEAGLQSWLKAYNLGQSFESITKGFLNSDEYKSLYPSFDVGTNFVTEDTPAMVHKGERIMPAADNAELMRRLDVESSSLDMQALERKLDSIREAIVAGDIANVQQTRETTRILKRFDQDGLPPERDVS